MELALHTFVSCPYTTAFLCYNDYCQFEIALSGYFSTQDDTNDTTKSELNSKMINDACRMAFRWTFFKNVNSNKHHLLDRLLKPMIGETYKHLWCYINVIHELNNNYQQNPISQRITVFEIYALLSFHFLHVNAEYVVQLLNINQYPSKLHDIIYILNQFLVKLTKIRSNCKEALISNSTLSANTSIKINVIYREYSVAHLLSILGDYETASIAIDTISDECKQHCLDNKDNKTTIKGSVIPLSQYFKQLYIYLLYNGCETYVERLYSNTYVSDDESDNKMMFSAIEYADKATSVHWMTANTTQNMDESLRKLIYEYIMCQQRYLTCKLWISKSRASSLMAQTGGLHMLSAKYEAQLKESYSDIFSTTERLLQNTISDLNALYNQLADLLQYIDGAMLLRDKYSKHEWNEWMHSHNFNSIKCVIKSSDNVITQTVDKIKQFIDQLKQNTNDTKEEEHQEVKEDGNDKNNDELQLNSMDKEILYEIRFKIQTLICSVSISLIESNSVLGELLYCAASVNLDSMELILNKTSLQLTDASILKTLDAIVMFMDHYYSDQPFNDISLLLLIRMLKDLGKVCGFKRYALWSQAPPTKEKTEECVQLIVQAALNQDHYLKFAAIIGENLIGKNHAVSKNIARLSQR